MTIHVRNWEKFQHPDVARGKVRVPPWIKLYTELHSDEAFLSLTGHQRAVLFGIWIEYARTRRQLPDSTASLSRRLNLRVVTRDLDALNQAGFLEILQAERKQKSTLEERRQEQTVRSNGSVDVAAPLNLDELEAVEGDAESAEAGANVVELDSRRPQAEINGRPLSDVLDGLLAQKRAQPP